jgi:antirestriction protein ArdC
LKVLKNDKRAVFQAASHAERAVTFLHSLQPGAVTRHDEETEQVPVAA